MKAKYLLTDHWFITNDNGITKIKIKIETKTKNQSNIYWEENFPYLIKIQILTSNMEECVTESIKAATDCFKTMNISINIMLRYLKTKQLCTEVQCLESE